MDLPGVGAATAEKLKSYGFSTLMSMAVASPGQLMEASGLTESMARKTIHFAREALNMGFESGDDLLKRIVEPSTPSRALPYACTILGSGQLPEGNWKVPN